MDQRQPNRFGRRVEALWFSFARSLVVGACRILFRIRIEGRDLVPEHGAFVLAPSHRSNIDFAIAGNVTRRQMRFMAKEAIWKRPFGRLWNSLGVIPVQRGIADRNAIRLAEEALRAGAPVVMFPEGTRQSGPTIQPLFDGVAYVAAQTGVPIVPVGLGGTESAMPKGAKTVRPANIRIVVGKPIPPPMASRTGRIARSDIRQLTARLRAELQDLFDAAQR